MTNNYIADKKSCFERRKEGISPFLHSESLADGICLPGVEGHGIIAQTHRKEGRALFREIEHTSETGFVAEGETLEEVFADAAKALFEIMTDTTGVGHSVKRSVTLEAQDMGQLMHAWLEELNYLSQTEHEFYSRFEVRVEENRLKASLGGELIDFEKHELRSEVKAITYGDFYFRKTDRGTWQTQVIVDV